MRVCLSRLDDWLQRLATTLPKPEKAPLPDGGFRWEYPEQTAEVVMLAKAVRMVSALNAAALLAQRAFTTEVGSLLRIVKDLATEILAVGEGVAKGKLTRSQQAFVDQFFNPLPRSLEEFKKQERESYVGRKDLYKAHKRLTENTPVNGEELVEYARFLDRGYDSYVHGGYATAMELYDGSTQSFMVSGHRYERHRCEAKVSVSQKLYYGMVSLEFMAMLRADEDLVGEIRDMRHELEAAPEYGGEHCD